ncbi:hypothetical protein LTR37_020763 [Vermiconidia calcicola]|uniref:Uncharacterized protein n=1 Tax=Vermiconidia calcicola TaxID=1690605 RepID=A0ACC3MAJ5_9PEZI|nr:hypothetical protein LTR37_020763 [Vermiconidia calcicola]
MNDNLYPLPADPPAYSATVAAPPTTLQRSLDDTRQLILANGSILKSRNLDPIELIIGKARPPNPSAISARFSSTTSNFTINLTDSGTPETNRVPKPNPGVRTTGRHYAALVSRDLRSTAIDNASIG